MQPKKQATSTTVRQRLNQITGRLTVGRMTSEGRHYHINSAVLGHVEQMDANTISLANEKR